MKDLCKGLGLAFWCLGLTWDCAAFGDSQGMFLHPAAWGRSAVFGSAFVAVADDASALYWNPAGIARLRHRYQTAFSHAELFSGLGLRHNSLSFVRSNNLWGTGIGVDHLKTSDILAADSEGNLQGTLSYSETRLMASLARSIESLRVFGRFVKLKLGVSAKFLNVGGDSMSQRAWGFDLGERTTLPLKRNAVLRIGVTGQNIFNSLEGADFRVKLGSALVLRSFFKFRQTIFAVGYLPQSGRSVIGLEGDLSLNGVDTGLSLGFEPSTDEGVVWRFGIQIGLDQGRSYFSLEDRQYLGTSQRFAVEADWGHYQGPVSVESLWIRRIVQGTALNVPSGKTLFTTDKVVVEVFFSIDEEEADLSDSDGVLVIYNPDSKEVERVGFANLDFADGKLVYTIKPAGQWLEKAGFLASGPYRVVVMVDGQEQARRFFALEYDTEAVEAVEDAYRAVGSQNIEKVKDPLLLARRLDPSYPNTYYVAGLFSEIVGDFKGAWACYEEAARLSGNKPISQVGQKIDIVQITTADYLRELAQSQSDVGIGLCNTLKNR